MIYGKFLGGWWVQTWIFGDLSELHQTIHPASQPNSRLQGSRVPGFESSSLVARIRDAPVHYLEIETPEALLLNKWHEIRYNVGFSPKSMGNWSISPTNHGNVHCQWGILHDFTTKMQGQPTMLGNFIVTYSENPPKTTAESSPSMGTVHWEPPVAIWDSWLTLEFYHRGKCASQVWKRVKESLYIYI